MIPRVERALLEGVSAVEEVGLRYAIVEGLALGVWAIPRATRDVDLYVELPASSRSNLRETLTRRGFDVPAMDAELAQFGVFRSKLLKERVFLDIFDAVGPLGESILNRKRRVTAAGRDLWFASAEDLALLKAFSDRPRDHDDLVALVSISEPPLDEGYLKRWTTLLDESIGGTEVSDRIMEARRRASGRHG